MPRYSRSPLGLVLYSQQSDNPSVGQYGVVSGTFSSLFSNSNKFQPDPNSNYSNDITTEGIIEYTSKISSMKLKYSDFAYLKNIGVFPNNRLIIARRFDSGVDDDLTTLKDVTPVSTLISWVPDNTDFISTEFGEEWTDGEASFRNILNDLGKDTLMGDNKGGKLGDVMAGAAGVVPLAGFTEGLQYEIFKKLGMTDLDAGQLPLGNPNLIRESKRRKTIDKESAGSGLKCKFKVDMTVEYEQKFINGVDQTIVYYDIIANALTFGSSESKFQFRGNSVSKFNEFLDDIGSGDSARLKKALLDFVGKIADAIHQVGAEMVRSLSKVKGIFDANKDADQIRKDQNEKEKITIEGFIKNIGAKVIQGLVSKYKIRIVSVVNSLTGTPSAPWHVTVGNPRRPIFSSGDMLVEEVKLSMGKVLAFNDLPSSIKLTLTLTSARNLGSQEIYKKFNCGKERTYVKLRRSFVETELIFSDNDLNNSVNSNAAQTISQNAVVPATATQTDVVNKGDIYPQAIKDIGGITYKAGAINANGERPVIAEGKVKFSMKNPDGTSSLKDQTTQFYPNGRLHIVDQSGKVIGSGNWTPDKGSSGTGGGVKITPDDDKFKGGFIVQKN